MSTTQTSTRAESLAKIAKKSGKTVAEVTTAFDEALTTQPPSYTDKQKEKYALKCVNRDLNVNAKSTAVAYEGIIFGVGRVRDLMSGINSRALTAYNENPQQALDAGIVKLDGENVVVLDDRKEIAPGKPNPKFGQPRPKEMLMKECILAVRLPGETNYKPGKISLWNQSARLSTPVGRLVGFKANGELADGEYKLRSAVSTAFETKQDLDPNEVVRILDTAFEGHYKELGECFEYRKSIEGTPARYDHYVITEGSVSYIAPPPAEADKNRRIVINDDTLGEDAPSVTVWFPNVLSYLLDFGVGTIVSVVAQTGIGKEWDSKEKKQTDKDILQLNGYSIFGRPGLKTAPQEDGEII